MKFTVLTLFPEIVSAFFSASIMAKAVERGIIECEFVNIRDFALDKHKTCDDVTYGGGAGMLMLPEPLARALDSVGAKDKHVVYPSPSGHVFTQDVASHLAKKDEIVLLCGRYEGIDQRIIDEYVDEELSIGDYVLSSGEVATLVVVDAVYRLIDGVISPSSLENESFVDFLLEYPQYTKPAVFRERCVPEVLLSGHHANIEKWRHKKRIEKTYINRPDLIEKSRKLNTWTSENDRILEEFINER
ncbi:MAG: tRNA (guanosine(37)-N1)-methyltransferase TrmD, partial [Treponema sp.]